MLHCNVGFTVDDTESKQHDTLVIILWDVTPCRLGVLGTCRIDFRAESDFTKFFRVFEGHFEVREIWNSHNDVSQDCSPLGCDAVVIGR